MSFIVGGLARSATKFLHHVLNTSHKYRVFHETTITSFKSYRKTDRLFLTLSKLQDCFDVGGEFYGEVNHNTAEFIQDVPIKAILVRDIDKVILSHINKFYRRCNKANKLEELIRHVIENNGKSIEHLKAAIDSGIPTIRFSGITGDINYLKSVAKALGVSDVNWKNINIRHKVGASPVRVREFRLLPDLVKTLSHDIMWWTEDNLCKNELVKYRNNNG